ncbi:MULTISPECIES: peptide chain release factor N(5)-glutamine methyltransferase [unclassified Mycolicibacterium]|uniref:peptide chain release factor N(5)-glutamine methyltransferase n=1 Tax=unclassified Mycolicibacterium TaxID=2636767 RepID=UPI0012DE5254|nr:MULTISPECIES: peptide chain release factor N(5)-glutamine methyltransferase [unclassified Mycolicibacterium]MUL84834.1 peptide chain release factor N(5)-glutamine methyltransferase [Mycolicibacterium sp. CBMA 329]MUL90801.1 peptide chain release factor N(5)-glutamine methyltransferase [Mycolicibacterium sp. CBMA 331]MUM01749.1 peptide chain release factor N(5)-glutamine methyltransferase [Mycolicibacterium sp. CBMA 334]MUM30004.1 peptide chain release factor N(5)-glutamine methyltransferase 
MTPVRQAIEAATARLAAAGVASPRIDAELLAAHVAGVDRGRLMMLDDPGEPFKLAYDELVTARCRRIPLQHLVGTAAFGPLTLAVGPGVFIPRPETEALLEWALGRQLPDNPVIVDLCTGSGALALALAERWPGARVIAVEDSPAALEFARRNAAGTRVEVLAADVTTPGLLPELDDRVDLLVSNPPYIPEAAVLEPEVADHDPAHALFGGPDGMAVIRPIVALAARWLRDGAACAVEHDDTTSELTVEAFVRDGHFTEVTARRDLAGRPRFVTATRIGRS